MKALVTGASSGIGSDIAKELCKRGYDLILVARRKERMEELAGRLGCRCEIICCDLSDAENCKKLYGQVENEDIEVLVNCAGFGVFGEFSDTDLQKEIDMINTNITALHILTKLFLNKFINCNRGYILNVASIASFAPGPMFSSYYASKAYVLRLTEAICEEMKRRNKNVHLSVLCPGPVDTEFNGIAGVRFTVGSITSEYAARYAVDKMFKGREVIVPGFKMKIARFGSKLLPDRLLAKVTYNFQKKKEVKTD